MKSKAFQWFQAAVGSKVASGSAEMFAALIRSERIRYEKLVCDANIKLA